MYRIDLCTVLLYAVYCCVPYGTSWFPCLSVSLISYYQQQLVMPIISVLVGIISEINYRYLRPNPSTRPPPSHDTYTYWYRYTGTFVYQFCPTLCTSIIFCKQIPVRNYYLRSGVPASGHHLACLCSFSTKHILFIPATYRHVPVPRT